MNIIAGVLLGWLCLDALIVLILWLLRDRSKTGYELDVYELIERHRH